MFAALNSAVYRQCPGWGAPGAEFANSVSKSKPIAISRPLAKKIFELWHRVSVWAEKSDRIPISDSR